MDLTGIGSVADFAKTIAERFFPKQMDESEKASKTLDLINILEKREDSVVKSQKEIMVAEMNQSDNYTKRARPSIVYFGLAVIGLNHVVLPWLAWFKASAMPEIVLPTEFWYTWGGVCSVWVWGRSKEKMGSTDKLVKMITGGK